MELDRVSRHLQSRTRFEFSWRTSHEFSSDSDRQQRQASAVSRQASAVSRQPSASVSAARSGDPLLSRGTAGKLPARSGPRPETQVESGQSQLDQNGLAALADRLVEAMVGLDGVRLGSSGIGGPSARAGHLLPAVANGPAEAFIVGTEFGHVHNDGSGSLHMVLPTARAGEAVDAGWAEWHPTVAAHERPPNLVLVYGARNDDDFDVIWGLLQDSYSFAYGT